MSKHPYSQVAEEKRAGAPKMRCDGQEVADPQPLACHPLMRPAHTLTRQETLKPAEGLVPHLHIPRLPPPPHQPALARGHTGCSHYSQCSLGALRGPRTASTGYSQRGLLQILLPPILSKLAILFPTTIVTDSTIVCVRAMERISEPITLLGTSWPITR